MNDYRRNKPLPLIHQVRHIHYNFRNTNDMHIFRVKYEYLKKFPFILFPEAWNNFASAYKNEDNPFKFRSELKRDLILKHIEVACKQYGCVNCLYHIAHDIWLGFCSCSVWPGLAAIHFISTIVCWGSSMGAVCPSFTGEQGPPVSDTSVNFLLLDFFAEFMQNQ